MRRRVPQNAGPLAAGPFVGFLRVGGAPDDGGERVFPIRDRQPLQAQSPPSSVDLPAFGRPDGHQTVHGGYEAVSHLAGVARNVAVPFGAHDTSGSDPVDTWPTRWSTIVDLTHKVFYVIPVNSPAVFWVDFAAFDPKSSEILALDPYDVRLSGNVSAQLKSFGSVQNAWPPAP